MKQLARRSVPVPAKKYDEAHDPQPSPHPGLGVRFIETDRPLVSVLEVRVPSERDVMTDVYRILYDLRVQVVHATAWHGRTSHRYHLSVVEFDGAALERRRHGELVAAIGRRLQARISVLPGDGRAQALPSSTDP
jgi:hypothetical protein